MILVAVICALQKIGSSAKFFVVVLSFTCMNGAAAAAAYHYYRHCHYHCPCYCHCHNNYYKYYYGC